MKNWFSSDPHWGHKNIIRYCNRPFENVQIMNETLIMNFNARVRPEDNLYFTGDLFFCDKSKAAKILARLNGKKYLVLGNHDKMIKKNIEFFEPYFEYIGDYLEIKVQDPDASGGSQMICLFHYSQKVWNQSHRGSWQLYGHSHGSLPDDPNALQMDVGVDCNNYYPFSYEEIKKRMKKKTYTPIDHHGNNE